MDFFNSIEFYTLALVVAFSLLGLIFSPKKVEAATLRIEPIFLRPCHGSQPAAEGTLTLSTGDDGVITVTHTGFTASADDLFNLAVTVTGDHVQLEEKKGYAGHGTDQSLWIAQARIEGLAGKQMAWRWESEVTGQWCRFEYTAIEGNTKTISLHY